METARWAWKLVPGACRVKERAAVARHARQLAVDVLDLCGVPSDPLADVALAMGEALNNAAVHAECATILTVRVRWGHGLASFRVRDNGRLAFDAEAVLAIEERSTVSLVPSGRGLLIARGVLDELRVWSGRSGTLVRGERRWM